MMSRCLCVLAALATVQIALSAKAETPETENSITLRGGQLTSSTAILEPGDTWLLEQKGFVRTALDFPKTGVYTFVVLLRGVPALDEWPETTVLFDFEPAYTAVINSTNWASYTFSKEIPAGLHEVAVRFDNDYYDDFENRNLFLDSMLVVSEPDCTPASRPDEKALSELQAERFDLWREGIEEQIRSLRKGKLAVWVSAPDGQPATGVLVRVTQTSHAFPFGIQLRPDMFQRNATDECARTYRSVVTQLFNSAGSGDALDWMVLEKNKDKPRYRTLDSMGLWCQDNGIALRGNNLFNGCQVPDWTGELDDRTFAEAARSRASETSDRFRTQIFEYDIISSPLHCPPLHASFTHADLPDLCEVVTNLNADAVLFVSDRGMLTADTLDRFVNYVSGLIEAGTPIGGIGVETKIDKPVDPIFLTHRLDGLARLHLPIKITSLTCSLPDEEMNQQCFSDMLRTAFAHPSVNGIILNPSPADDDSTAFQLFDKDGRLTSLGETYHSFVFSNWWTRVEDRTDHIGRMERLAYFGRYRVEATSSDGRTVEASVFLDPRLRDASITLHLPATNESSLGPNDVKKDSERAEDEPVPM